MRISRLYILLIVVLPVIYLACDTANNVEPRSDNFFVKLYAGVKAGNQFGNDVIATSDGGFLIAGTSENEDGTKEIILIKTDLQGNQEWIYNAETDLANMSSEAASILELGNGYVVGGTVDNGVVRRSVLLNIDFQGALVDSSFIITSDAGGEKANQLSKITMGLSGILVSGETLRLVAGLTGGINGYIGLIDPASLAPTRPLEYFGLNGDDLVTGAYEVSDIVGSVGPQNTRFLVFGSSQNANAARGFDYYYAGFQEDFTPTTGITDNRIEVDGDQMGNDIAVLNDRFWMIGETKRSGSQIYMVGWEFSPNTGNISDWARILGSEEIRTGDDISGQAIAFQDVSNYVIVSNFLFSNGINTEIYLAKVDNDRDIKPPWPKTYGTTTSTYEASSITTLEDGSIIVLGTADLDPIKKIILIKTGPNGQMSF